MEQVAMGSKNLARWWISGATDEVAVEQRGGDRGVPGLSDLIFEPTLRRVPLT
jgi:hypothetical protein